MDVHAAIDNESKPEKEDGIGGVTLLFATQAHIPSATAHSGNILRMSQAFADVGARVKLFVKWEQPQNHEYGVDDSIGRQFGVEGSFEVLPAPHGRLCYGLHLIGIVLRSPKETVFYTREIRLAALVRLSGRRVGFHAHSGLSRRIGGRLDRLLLRLLDFPVFVVSEGMKNLYQDKHGLDPDRIQLIRNGVSVRRFTIPSSKTEIRSALGITVDAPTCVYSGSLYAGRGIEILLAVARQLPNCEFVVVGGTSAEITELSPPSLSNVHFVGYQTHDRIPLYLAAADILLMPYQKMVATPNSQTDASILGPLKLYEYLAAGRAIIASDLPALREVLSEDVALLVQPDSVEHWRIAIERLAEDVEKRELLAATAGRLAQRHEITDRAAEVIDAILAYGTTASATS